MPTNTAAWLDSPFTALTVRPAPYTAPGADEIVIRNRAIAVNPLDASKQSTGDFMYRWLPYPSVLGEDVAGEVVEIGSSVTRFQVGDRVVAYAVGMEKDRKHQAEGGFQEFTVARELLTSPIPADMSFEDAAVLPLGISTAASALFQKNMLGLRHPTASSPATGETVIVWGASTSVGSNAIQLAVAAGYNVVTTASPRNHDRALALGASKVFDYASPTVVADIIAATKGSSVVGIVAVGTGSAQPSVDIAIATGAKRIALTSPSVSLSTLPQQNGFSLGLVKFLAKLVTGTMAMQVRCRVRGISAGFVWGSALMNNEVGPMLWGKFLPQALAEGKFVPSPQPEVVGHGLEHVQSALEALNRGVSARKLVVTL